MRKTASKNNSLPLPDLQEKISQLGTALFFPETKAVLKFPVHVITVDRIDEQGFLVFRIPHPGQSLQEFEQEFPVKLDFYKKGSDFFVKIDGKARIDSQIGGQENVVPSGGQLKPTVGLRVEISTAHFFQAAEKLHPQSKASRKMLTIQSTAAARSLPTLRPIPVFAKK
jgi:hypothetical protein